MEKEAHLGEVGSTKSRSHPEPQGLRFHRNLPIIN